MDKKDNGIFVVIEGCDCVGKSTVSKIIVEKLKEIIGDKVVYTYNPYKEGLAGEISKVFYNNNMDDKTRALLVLSAISANMENNILPALNDGKIVICDRFVRSTLIYQGFSDYNKNMLDYACFNHAALLATKYRYPDYEFVLQIPFDELLRRKGIRNEPEDIIESKGLDFLKKVYEGYKDDRLFILGHSMPTVIDAIYDPEEVAQDILSHIIFSIMGNDDEN